ncbi:MAG: DUF1684 domain-containing protein [Ekhidna sp.]
MKKIALVLVPIAVVIFYFTNIGVSDEDYITEIEKYWEDKHDFFRTSKASPFVEKGVSYKKVETFPVNPDFRVNARLERFTSRETVTIGNSDGTQTNYLKFAKAHFKIKGVEQSLLVLKALGFGNQYLMAFGDETSGETTYGGGRYLDLAIGKSDQVVIDFNKAYNPYCAYFADYTCPLPPRENLLTVAIEAGEKDYPHTGD